MRFLAVGTGLTVVEGVIKYTATAYGSVGLPLSCSHDSPSPNVGDQNVLEMCCPRTKLSIVILYYPCMHVHVAKVGGAICQIQFTPTFWLYITVRPVLIAIIL